MSRLDADIRDIENKLDYLQETLDDPEFGITLDIKSILENIAVGADEMEDEIDDKLDTDNLDSLLDRLEYEICDSIRNIKREY